MAPRRPEPLTPAGSRAPLGGFVGAAAPGNEPRRAAGDPFGVVVDLASVAAEWPSSRLPVLALRGGAGRLRAVAVVLGRAAGLDGGGAAAGAR